MGAVEFTALGDGREIAYRVVSDNDGPTIVHITGGMVPIEVLDDDPMYARFLRTLGRYGRVAVLDRPGVGASDSFDPDRDLLDQVADAFVAVLDAVGAGSAWLVMKQGFVALRLIERHPRRLAGLAMLSGLSPASMLSRADMLETVLSRDVESADQLAWLMPTRVEDLAYRAWHERAGRLGATATAARAWYEASFDSIARNLSVGPPPDRLPALVVHRRRMRQATTEDAQWWVRAFGAELELIDGADHFIEGADAGVLADTFGSFMTGARIGGPEDRPLLAVLFTDVVESTATVAAFGDARWRSLLDRYEEGLESVVHRHSGTLVKHTGDGALAAFATGSRAIAAATEVRSLTRDLGLEGRTGIHLGEVEQRGDDIGGLAVHLAARVMDAAEPGQILATSTLARSTLGGTVAVRPLGPRILRGFDEPWELFAVGGATE